MMLSQWDFTILGPLIMYFSTMALSRAEALYVVLFPRDSNALDDRTGLVGSSRFGHRADLNEIEGTTLLGLKMKITILQSFPR